MSKHFHTLKNEHFTHAATDHITSYLWWNLTMLLTLALIVQVLRYLSLNLSPPRYHIGGISYVLSVVFIESVRKNLSTVRLN